MGWDQSCTYEHPDQLIGRLVREGNQIETVTQRLVRNPAADHDHGLRGFE